MVFFRRLSSGLIGWLLGLIVPLGTLLLMIHFFIEGPWAYKMSILDAQDRMGTWISLSAIPNLLMFAFWIRKKKDNAAQGILGATFFWAIVTLFYTFN